MSASIIMKDANGMTKCRTEDTEEQAMDWVSKAVSGEYIMVIHDHRVEPLDDNGLIVGGAEVVLHPNKANPIRYKTPL